MSCICMDSPEIVGNILCSPSLSSEMNVSVSDVLEYCQEISKVLPGYTMFESTSSQIANGVTYWNKYATWNPSANTFSLREDHVHPDPSTVNRIYPKYLAHTIEVFTEYWVYKHFVVRDNSLQFCRWAVQIAE